MYCRKCGAKLCENARFCGRCGEAVIHPQENPANAVGSDCQTDASAAIGDSCYEPQPVIEKENHAQTPLWILSTICGILAVILLFSNWFVFRYSPLFQQVTMRIPLFHISALGSRLQSLGVYLDLSLLPFRIAFSGLVASVLLGLLGVIGAWAKKPQLRALGLAGNGFGFILTLLIILCTAAMDALLRSNAILVTDRILSLTATPYLMLLLFAAGFVLTLLSLRKSKKRTYLFSLLIGGISVLGVMLLTLGITLGTHFLFHGIAPNPSVQEIPSEYYYDDFFGGYDGNDSSVAPR